MRGASRAVTGEREGGRDGRLEVKTKRSLSHRLSSSRSDGRNCCLVALSVSLCASAVAAVVQLSLSKGRPLMFSLRSFPSFSLARFF